MKHCKKTEQFKIEFFGFKLDCTNPGIKSIFILVIILIFFIGILFAFRHSILGLVAIGGAKSISQAIQLKLPFLRNISAI